MRPDLVLLDGQMPPGVSGCEACQALRDDELNELTGIRW